MKSFSSTLFCNNIDKKKKMASLYIAVFKNISMMICENLLCMSIDTSDTYRHTNFNV